MKTPLFHPDKPYYAVGSGRQSVFVGGYFIFDFFVFSITLVCWSFHYFNTEINAFTKRLLRA